MRLEKKDLLLPIPATLLAIAGLGPDDPWVVGPCLVLSWASFIFICAIHEGSLKIRLIVGVVITLALAGVGYRRFYSIIRATERAEIAKKEPSSQPEAHPSEPPKALIAKPKAPKPIKNPLEIVGFRSDYAISIANNGAMPTHVLSLVLKHDYETKSFGLALDIGPGKIAQELIHEEGFLHVRTSRRLGDTWDEHVKKAKQLYGSCGMRWTYFAPSDASLQQIKDSYTKQNLVLGYSDISGTLYYRLEGRQGRYETDEQTVPIVATITVNNDTCPRDLVFTPRALPSP